MNKLKMFGDPHKTRFLSSYLTCNISVEKSHNIFWFLHDQIGN